MENYRNNIGKRVLKRSINDSPKKLHKTKSFKSGFLINTLSKLHLKNRLKEPEMIFKMKESGFKVDKSGIDSKIRWNHEKM